MSNQNQVEKRDVKTTKYYFVALLTKLFCKGKAWDIIFFIRTEFSGGTYE